MAEARAGTTIPFRSSSRSSRRSCAQWHHGCRCNRGPARRCAAATPRRRRRAAQRFGEFPRSDDWRRKSIRGVCDGRGAVRHGCQHPDTGCAGVFRTRRDGKQVTFVLATAGRRFEGPSCAAWPRRENKAMGGPSQLSGAGGATRAPGVRQLALCCCGWTLLLWFFCSSKKKALGVMYRIYNFGLFL